MSLLDVVRSQILLSFDFLLFRGHQLTWIGCVVYRHDVGWQCASLGNSLLYALKRGQARTYTEAGKIPGVETR